ncbi:phage capsid protein [Glycomyces buryatensis]|uniref:P22 coat protein-protein 5 domain protein n=1 Tax=Glycomyces buryatensis TaxID=2570927 RepID=A0A4S8QPW6_9ACTN|nr:phage capsid protein [Glycomyces buryatensis]THV43459.1 hypothetical protein FAB82_00950 [Glycomyces buryatensis]
MAVINFIPEVWSATILDNFKQHAVIEPTVATEYEGDATMGNVVHITSFATPTIVNYAVGTSGVRTVDPEALNDSGQPLNIDQEKAFAFYVDDIDKRQAAGGMEPVTRDAAAGLVEDAETFLADLMLADGTDRTNAEAIEGEGAGNEAFEVVKRLRTELSASPIKAPLSGRTLLVNPEFSAFLLGADSKLTNVDTSGDAAGLRNATIGQLLGFRVAETSLLNPGSATCIAYHRSAIGYVNQVNTIEALRAQNKFADILRGLMVYGARVLRPTAVRYWTEGIGS